MFDSLSFLISSFNLSFSLIFNLLILSCFFNPSIKFFFDFFNLLILILLSCNCCFFLIYFLSIICFSSKYLLFSSFNLLSFIFFSNSFCDTSFMLLYSLFNSYNFSLYLSFFFYFLIFFI